MQIMLSVFFTELCLSVEGQMIHNQKKCTVSSCTGISKIYYGRKEISELGTSVA